VRYQRQVVGLDGRTVKQESACVDVVIKPGTHETVTLTFKSEGNQQPKCESSDLIVKFKLVEGDAHSSLFKRQGASDLMYTHKTTMADVIQCKPIRLTSLDGMKLNIAVD
jgi:DnaJ-class molecular chaperone